MTAQALLVIGVVALGLLVLVLDQVRRDRLYVGYGVALVLAIVALVVIAAVPPLLRGLTRILGTVLPGSALVLLSLAFILFVLVYVLTQVTIVANRVAAVVQELAIRGAAVPQRQTRHEDPADGDSSNVQDPRAAGDGKGEGR